MRWSARSVFLATLLVTMGAGCSQRSFPVAQSPGFPAGQPSYAAQLEDLNQRASALDADNRDLHTELARSQQQVRVLRDELGLLREQLKEKATEVQEMLAAKDEATSRVKAIEASTRYKGGATITANSSLRNALPLTEIPGVEVRRDDDLIRLELPADRLFEPGTDQMLPTAQQWLERVAEAIASAYGQQLIGVEGHTDRASRETVANYRLASAQAVTVLDALTRSGHLQLRQLFTVGYGPSHPRVSNGTPAGRASNRRIEVVVYPETLPNR